MEDLYESRLWYFDLLLFTVDHQWPPKIWSFRRISRIFSWSCGKYLFLNKCTCQWNTKTQFNQANQHFFIKCIGPVMAYTPPSPFGQECSCSGAVQEPPLRVMEQPLHPKQKPMAFAGWLCCTGSCTGYNKLGPPSQFSLPLNLLQCGKSWSGCSWSQRRSPLCA